MRSPSPQSARAWAATLTVVLAVLACGPVAQATATPPATPPPPATPVPPQAPTSTPTIAVTHVRFPGNPGTAVQYMTDSASIGTAAQHRAMGGDYFNINLYERPFTSQTMNYLPWVDITRSELAWDGQWFYVSIKLQASPLTAPDQPTDYMAEFDVNRDGRGEYLILAKAPKGTSWTTDGVFIYQDLNHDVGGATPVLSDTHPGDGYETLAFNQGQGPDPDAAWVRISPSDPATVQLAFLPDAIGNSATFVWWTWADRGVQRPDWFDYNDHFTQAQAGSPLVEDKAYYPIQQLWGVDNTCRMAYGFTPPSSMLGLCSAYVPPAAPKASGTPGVPIIVVTLIPIPLPQPTEPIQ